MDAIRPPALIKNLDTLKSEDNLTANPPKVKWHVYMKMIFFLIFQFL